MTPTGFESPIESRILIAPAGVGTAIWTHVCFYGSQITRLELIELLFHSKQLREPQMKAVTGRLLMDAAAHSEPEHISQILARWWEGFQQEERSHVEAGEPVAHEVGRGPQCGEAAQGNAAARWDPLQAAGREPMASGRPEAVRGE